MIDLRTDEGMVEFLSRCTGALQDSLTEFGRVPDVVVVLSDRLPGGFDFPRIPAESSIDEVVARVRKVAKETRAYAVLIMRGGLVRCVEDKAVNDAGSIFEMIRQNKDKAQPCAVFCLDHKYIGRRAWVLDVDLDRRRISLSRRQAGDYDGD